MIAKTLWISLVALILLGLALTVWPLLVDSYHTVFGTNQGVK